MIDSLTLKLFETFILPPENLADLVKSDFPHHQKKLLFDKMVEDCLTLSEAIYCLDFATTTKEDIKPLCEQLIADNPQVVKDIKAGKQAAVGALIGQARKTAPDIDPKAIRRTCLDLIAP